MGYHTSAARATCVGCGGNLEIRAEFCRCTGARFWRSCHQSRVNERSESNRRHQASLSTFEVQGAAGRAVAIARCSVRRHRASCSSLDLSKTGSASVARTGPKKSHSEIISLSALPVKTQTCQIPLWVVRRSEDAIQSGSRPGLVRRARRVCFGPGACICLHGPAR